MNRRKLLDYGAIGLSAAALRSVLSTGRSRAATQSALNDIEQIVIHPAIGIARVGNSPDAWFLGPEVALPPPVPADGFRDAAGRIKRQAARFRLYGLNRDGQAIAKVTAEDASIRWTVHLANTKAAGYNFDLALDIPEAKGLPPAPLQPAPASTRSTRRNAAITERTGLRIDPGARSVGGRNANVDGADASARFAGGTFLDKDIPLGELRTDDAGRRLVFGGMGSAGPTVPGALAVTFANNDLWWDDTSDSPVDATVGIGDRETPVTGAWVVVAPPNYAPGIRRAHQSRPRRQELHSVITPSTTSGARANRSGYPSQVSP